MRTIDQTRLSAEEAVISLGTVKDLAEAISRTASPLAPIRPTAVNLKRDVDGVERAYDPARPDAVEVVPIERARATGAEDEGT